MKNIFPVLAVALALAAGSSGCNDSGPLGPSLEPTEEGADAPDPDADALPEGVSGEDLLHGCTAPMESRDFDKELFVWDGDMPHDASVFAVLQTREFIGEWTLYERLDDYEDDEEYEVNLNSSTPVVNQYHRAVATNGLTVMVDPDTGEMAFALGNRKDEIADSDEADENTWVKVPDLWCGSGAYTNGAFGISFGVSKLDPGQELPQGVYPSDVEDKWIVATSGAWGELTRVLYELHGAGMHNGDDSYTPTDLLYYDLTGMAESEVPDYSGSWYSADQLNAALEGIHADMSTVSDAILDSVVMITEEGHKVAYYPPSAFSTHF